jgi:ubiquinone/menaquinone biosynthesis C-methylase UbiE
VERQGLYRLLRAPTVYNAVQTIMGAEYSPLRTDFIKFAGIKSGDRVLDIGCGSGRMRLLMPAVSYIGWEPAEGMVEIGRRDFPDAEFHAGYFDSTQAEETPAIDVAILCAVLHHMPDDEVRVLLAAVKRCLRPGGNIAFLDCVFHDRQNMFAAMLARMDRGRHVRTPEASCALVRRVFPQVEGRLIEQKFPPYSFWIMRASY